MIKRRNSLRRKTRGRGFRGGVGFQDWLSSASLDLPTPAPRGLLASKPEIAPAPKLEPVIAPESVAAAPPEEKEQIQMKFVVDKEKPLAKQYQKHLHILGDAYVKILVQIGAEEIEVETTLNEIQEKKDEAARNAEENAEIEKYMRAPPKTTNSKIELTEDQKARFEKMKKILPEHVLRIKMKSESIPPEAIDNFFNPSPPENSLDLAASSTNENLEPSKDAYKKYAKMKEVGVPDGAIRSKMSSEGVSPEDIDKFFASFTKPKEEEFPEEKQKIENAKKTIQQLELKLPVLEKDLKKFFLLAAAAKYNEDLKKYNELKYTKATNLDVNNLMFIRELSKDLQNYKNIFDQVDSRGLRDIRPINKAFKEYLDGLKQAAKSETAIYFKKLMENAATVKNKRDEYKLKLNKKRQFKLYILKKYGEKGKELILTWDHPTMPAQAKYNYFVSNFPEENAEESFKVYFNVLPPKPKTEVTKVAIEEPTEKEDQYKYEFPVVSEKPSEEDLQLNKELYNFNLDSSGRFVDDFGDVVDVYGRKFTSGGYKRKQRRTKRRHYGRKKRLSRRKFRSS